MKYDIYKTMKYKGDPVQYERDTHNVYSMDGFFLFVGFLDGAKLKRAELTGETTGDPVMVEPTKEETKEEKKD